MPPAVTYTLWRWVFPRLRARTLLGGITLQVLVSLLTFAVLSALTTELIASLRGAPSLFGAPTGLGKQVTITPEQQQAVVRLYGPAHLPEITSAPGSGTRVRLRLPVRPAQAA